jgi:hypothetical protein
METYFLIKKDYKNSTLQIKDETQGSKIAIIIKEKLYF